MIDEEYYVFPHEEPKHVKTETEQQAAKDNEDALYDFGFRPLGYEW